jgi:CHAD domain-containing protein
MVPKTSVSDLLLRQRLSALSRTLIGARAGDMHAIHQARVATRRLREAVALMPSQSTARRLQRAARRLTRALGPVRELDVALQTLDELQREGDVPRPAVTCLRQLMTAERRLLQAEAVKIIDRGEFERLRQKLAEKERADAEKGRVTSTTTRRESTAFRRVVRRGERLRGAMDNAAGIYLPDRLHAVRIAVKKLRYAIEVLQQMSGSRASRARTPSKSLRSVNGQLAALKRAQELLGRMHDLEVLIARTRAVQASPQAPNLRLSGDLDRLVRRLETECRLLHGHYMASRAQLIDICDRIDARAARAA